MTMSELFSDHEKITTLSQSRQPAKHWRCSPGHLMAPLGWAAEPLLDLVLSDPALLAPILQLGRQRMHVIALAFSHVQVPFNPQLGDLVVRGPLSGVFDAVLGRRPIGLKRALGHLPFKVMLPQSYVRLVTLLEDPASATMIYHATTIDASWIDLFFDIPVPLRRVVARASAGFFIRISGLMDGLRVLVSRGAAATLEELVADLAQSTNPIQLIARINRLIEGLPLPEVWPAQHIAGARRIDRIDEIRSFARTWKNCIEQYASVLEHVSAVIYYWPHEVAPALCLVTCHGRLGWLLDEVKGPVNSDLPPDRLAEIESAFSSFGIPPSSAIAAIKRVANAVTQKDLNAFMGQLRDEDEPYNAYQEFDAS
jgi:hypothetical protein